MDKRLKNVQQADLTESRVNDDFVYWLKTWGSNILIVVLLIAAAGMGYQWWQQRQAQARDDAWAELNSAVLPTALMEVAQKNQGKDSVTIFAELSAADRYMGAIVSGRRFDREPTASDAAITPELRAEWLKEADRLYASVAAASANPTAMGMRLFKVSALFGRASVAEDQRDPKAAEGYLQEIQTTVTGTDQAALGSVAAARIARLHELSSDIVFVSRPPADLGATPGSASGAISAPPLALTPTPAEGVLRPDGYVQLPDGTLTKRITGGTLKLVPQPIDQTPPNDGSDAPTPSGVPIANTPPATTPPPAPAPAPAPPKKP